MKVLNVFIVMENLTSVYRNFCTLKKPAQLLAALQVILVTLVYVASLIHLCVFEQPQSRNDDFTFILYISFYTLFSTTISIANFIIGIWQSVKFRIILTKINLVHQHYKANHAYKRAVQMLVFRTIVIAFFVILNCMCLLFTIIISAITEQLLFSDFFLVILSVTAIIAMCREAQFYLELIFFFFCISLVTIALKQIKMTLKMLVKITEQINDDEITSTAISCDQLQEKIDQINLIFECLKDCCDNLMQCFGFQVSLQIFLIVFKIRVQ